MEDTLEKKQRMNLLMDLYEDLLTEKQREYLDLYYHEDLSLSEISLIKNVSKNAVFDNIKKDVQFLLSSNIGEVLTIFTFRKLWRKITVIRKT